MKEVRTSGWSVRLARGGRAVRSPETFDEERMKKLTNILLFLCLQCAVIGLSIFVGWNYGLPADRARLDALERIMDDRLEQSWRFHQMQDNADIEIFQTAVELLQIKTNLIETIDVLNEAIDTRLERYSGMEFGDDDWCKWPNYGGQYPLFLRIAQYRRKYPASYISASWSMERKMAVGKLFDEVEKYQPQPADKLFRRWP